MEQIYRILNYLFHKFQFVELLAHFYTEHAPYVCSERPNTPDTWMSGAFCVTAFRTKGCTPCASMGLSKIDVRNKTAWPKPRRPSKTNSFQIVEFNCLTNPPLKGGVFCPFDEKQVNCNLAGWYGSAPWLSLWESCQPNRLTERVPQERSQQL